ncbi:hypothetical protein HN873_043018 [Arachis hypogaea]
MFCLPLSRQYHHILPIRHTHRQRSFCCRHRRKGVAAAVMAIFIAAATSFNPQLLELAAENGIDKRIVCVTSGGTTAPLEQRCVRYVDNFSSGHRGATFTEYLFLHLLLFLFLSMKLFLGYLFSDLLEGNEYYVAGYVEFREAYSKAVKTAIVDHHAAVDSGLRLKLPFSTIFEYLQMLQIISKPMKDIGPSVMFYLI